jgi:hypothetical protein
MEKSRRIPDRRLEVALTGHSFYRASTIHVGLAFLVHWFVLELTVIGYLFA